MANIEEQNIILRFVTETSQAKADIGATQKAVDSLGQSVNRIGEELTDAFKTKLAEKLFKLIKQGNVDIGNFGDNIDEIKKGIDDAFSTLSPEEFANAVKSVNKLLSETSDVEFDIAETSEKAFDAKPVAEQAKEVKKLNKDLTVTANKYSDVLDTPLTPEEFAAAMKEYKEQTKAATKEQEELKRSAAQAVPTFQNWQKEIKQTEPLFSRVRRAGVNAFNRIGTAVAGVAIAGFNKLRTGARNAFNSIGDGISKIARFAGRIGGIAAILGISDLIAGWSTFSKQFQATFNSLPGTKATFDRLTKTIRQIAEFMARTLEPIITRIGDALNEWLESVDFSGIQRIFDGIGIIFDNLAEQVGKLFGTEPGSITNLFIEFGFTAVAVINGIITALDEFAAATKAALLDLASFLLRIGSSLPVVGTQLAALQAAIEVLADDARANMGSISDAFLEGFNQIKALEKKPVDIKKIVPTPLPEEKEKLKKELEERKRLLEEWLNALNKIAEDVQGFQTPFESTLDSFTLLRQQIQGLITEADKLRKDGIISETQLKASKLLIDEYRKQAIEKLREELKKFELQTLKFKDSLEIVGLKKEIDEIGLSIKRFSDANSVREIVERQTQRASAESLRLEMERAEALDQLRARLDAIDQGLQAAGSSAVAIAEVQRAAVQEQIENLDRLARRQEQRVEQASRLAEKGNAELLQSEIERLDALEQAREQAVKRERAIAAVQIAIAQSVALAQGVVAVIRGFVDGGLITGIIQSVALAGTIASSIIAIKSAFSDLPAFWEGNPYIDGKHGRDQIVARVSRGERVFTVDQNKEIGGRAVPNSKVVERAKVGEWFEKIGYKVINTNTNSGLNIPDYSVEDFSSLSNLMMSLQNSQESRLDTLAQELVGLRHDFRNLAVNFNITNEGIEAAVKHVQNRRIFRNKIKR